MCLVYTLIITLFIEGFRWQNSENIGKLSKKLGIDTLNCLIQSCKNLTGIGNLRTWLDIDYYNPTSDSYYSNDRSELGRLRKKIVTNNWDLDLDLENLDFLYKI